MAVDEADTDRDWAIKAPIRSDPFQMAMIHRSFRREFGDLGALILTLPPRDTRRSTFVGNYLGNLISVLRHHHHAEDELLWPRLEAQIPSAGGSLREPRDEHAVIAAAIDAVESVRLVWARSADPRQAAELGAAIDKLAMHAGEHFDHEERDLVPLIARYITQREWQAFIDRGAAYVKPRNLWFSLAYAGALLRDASPDEQRRFLASLPVTLRTVVTLLGGRAYAGYRTKVYGVE